MSSFEILDAHTILRRELSLSWAAELRDFSFGAKQMGILFRLAQSNCSMRELSEFSQSDPAATSRTVASLEKAGLVIRKGDAKDSRKSIIELTAKGRKPAILALKIRDIIGKQVNASLSLNEQKELANLLRKAAAGIQGQRIRRSK